jgi:O-antigen/teichoic acid export membrane protein
VKDSGGLRLTSLLRVSAAHVRVGRVLSIVVLGALLGILTQTLLARTLPKLEVGVISLLLGALPLLSSISLLGQDAATVRFVSRSEAGRYDTRSHVRRVLLLVLPLGAAVGLVGARFYSLAGLAALAVVVLVISQNSIAVTTSIPRARHRYERAMIGRWLPQIATGVGLAVLFALRLITFDTALIAIIIAFASTALVYTAWQLRAGDSGAEPVPTAVVREGLFLFGITVSFSVMVALDKVVIGKMLPYSDLAVYATIFAVMKGFDFIFYSITYVLMPRVNTWESVNVGRLTASIGAVALVVAAVYLFLGDDVVRLLFAGRYDQGIYLIAPFALSGVLKLFYSVPSSIIGGRFPRAALRDFLWFNLAGIAVNVALDIALIRAMGLLGAAVATAIAWGIRVAGGYVVIARHRAHLGPAGEGPEEL